MDRRVAIVTGGSRGIGRAISIQLAKDGCDVIINYAGNQKAAEETAALCQKEGAKTLLVQGNVASMEDCENLVDAAVKTFGRIDILVNNAGITRDNILMRMSQEEFDQVIDTNLKGTFHMLKLVSKIMMKQRRGRIVNLASVVGIMGNVGQVNYSASKAGVIGMTKSLARELASRGVTVNAVAPGFIDTDMTKAMTEAAKAGVTAGIPMGKQGQPEDIATAVSFLASEGAGYITGQVLAVDGGMCM